MSSIFYWLRSHRCKIHGALDGRSVKEFGDMLEDYHRKLPKGLDGPCKLSSMAGADLVTTAWLRPHSGLKEPLVSGFGRLYSPKVAIAILPDSHVLLEHCPFYQELESIPSPSETGWACDYRNGRSALSAF